MHRFRGKRTKLACMQMETVDNQTSLWNVMIRYGIRCMWDAYVYCTWRCCTRRMTAKSGGNGGLIGSPWEHWPEVLIHQIPIHVQVRVSRSIWRYFLLSSSELERLRYSCMFRVRTGTKNLVLI
jgi:hypothetical protein